MTATNTSTANPISPAIGFSSSTPQEAASFRSALQASGQLMAKSQPARIQTEAAWPSLFRSSSPLSAPAFSLEPLQTLLESIVTTKTAGVELLRGCYEHLISFQSGLSLHRTERSSSLSSLDLMFQSQQNIFQPVFPIAALEGLAIGKSANGILDNLHSWFARGLESPLPSIAGSLLFGERDSSSRSAGSPLDLVTPHSAFSAAIALRRTNPAVLIKKDLSTDQGLLPRRYEWEVRRQNTTSANSQGIKSSLTKSLQRMIQTLWSRILG